MTNGFGITTGKTATTVLYGDGWYPDLAVAEFLKLYRLPAEYAESLIADHLKLACLWAAKLLAPWRDTQEAGGHGNLDAIAVHGIEKGATLLYKRAVFSYAKAILLQQFTSIERRDSARNDAKEAPETANQFLAAARQALADLTGRTFVTVEAL